MQYGNWCDWLFLHLVLFFSGQLRNAANVIAVIYLSNYLSVVYTLIVSGSELQWFTVWKQACSGFTVDMQCKLSI